jgi:3-deoxy-7-phosphoheptulonate synthase
MLALDLPTTGPAAAPTDGPTPAPALAPASHAALPSPAALRAALPCDDAAARAVARGRAAIADVLAGRDPRWVVIAGPCSLHDPAGTLIYARRLAQLAAAHRDTLVVAMRCYVEKPRTTLGWRGLVHDPDLDGRGDVARGLAVSRALLREINRLGLPCATELLDPIVARYLEDLVAWGGIGARTAQSQTHRELASGHPAPIGFKNATDGDVQPAIDAVAAARAPHTALTIDLQGRAVVHRTPGNAAAHVVLRGGSAGPNHDRATIERAAEAVARHPAERPILVDCSHGNSGKDPARQGGVLRELLAARSPRVAGALLESNLRTGRQSLDPGSRPRVGVSVTDACVGWRETRRLVEQLAASLRGGRPEGATMP